MAPATVDPLAAGSEAGELPAPVDLPPVVRPQGDPPIEAEAPAVPLSRGDEEYVSGRMTQAEILEKYGLEKQALEQVCEVTAKFPGHVPAQEKMVELQRESGGVEELRDTWVALALARRASGDAAGAREACAEAAASAPLDASATTMLAQLGLIDTVPEAASPAAVVPPPSETVPYETEPSQQEAAPAPVPVAEVEAQPEFESRSARDGEMFIDFDAMDDDEPEDTPAVELPPPAPETDRDDEVAPAAVPVADSRAQAPLAAPADPATAVVAEIGQLLDRDDIAEAERRLTALETLGWARDRVGQLRDRVEAARGPALAAEGPIDAAVAGADHADDDDLSAITAALESELFADDTTLITAEPESEESLEDVFAAFKEQVDREVSHDDYRTHYDLGIGYKEMGLVDEAIAEFERSVQSPDLGRESFAMLALCHRERDDLEAAARCYREAIATPNSDGETLKHLRYDLADVLLVAGDREGALDQLRDVMGADPSFRDVRERIAELESCPS
jgi:tetratricopeptide (TPR) repeat protein